MQRLLAPIAGAPGSPPSSLSAWRCLNYCIYNNLYNTDRVDSFLIFSSHEPSPQNGDKIIFFLSNSGIKSEKFSTTTVCSSNSLVALKQTTTITNVWMLLIMWDWPSCLGECDAHLSRRDFWMSPSSCLMSWGAEAFDCVSFSLVSRRTATYSPCFTSRGPISNRRGTPFNSQWLNFHPGL